MASNRKVLRFTGEQLIRNTANLLTGFRIFASALLLLFPVFSKAFYILYLLCGLSDMIDGRIARKTKSDSEFGAKLDTIADLAFLSASFVKILPTLTLPGWLWIWTIAIALLKMGNFILGYVLKKQLISLHTILNKITGALLFLLPLTFSFVNTQYSFIVICCIATFSALQEGYYIAKG